MGGCVWGSGSVLQVVVVVVVWVLTGWYPLATKVVIVVTSEHRDSRLLPNNRRP